MARSPSVLGGRHVARWQGVVRRRHVARWPGVVRRRHVARWPGSVRRRRPCRVATVSGRRRICGIRAVFDVWFRGIRGTVYVLPDVCVHFARTPGAFCHLGTKKRLQSPSQTDLEVSLERYTLALITFDDWFDLWNHVHEKVTAGIRLESSEHLRIIVNNEIQPCLYFLEPVSCLLVTHYRARQVAHRFPPFFLSAQVPCEMRANTRRGRVIGQQTILLSDRRCPDGRLPDTTSTMEILPVCGVAGRVSAGPVCCRCRNAVRIYIRLHRG